MNLNKIDLPALSDDEAYHVRGGIHFQIDRKGLHLDLKDPSKFTYRIKPSLGFFIRNWGTLRPHVKAISGAMIKDFLPNPFKLFRAQTGELNLGSILSNFINPES